MGIASYAPSTALEAGKLQTLTKNKHQCVFRIAQWVLKIPQCLNRHFATFVIHRVVMTTACLRMRSKVALPVILNFLTSNVYPDIFYFFVGTLATFGLLNPILFHVTLTYPRPSKPKIRLQIIRIPFQRTHPRCCYDVLSKLNDA